MKRLIYKSIVEEVDHKNRVQVNLKETGVN